MSVIDRFKKQPSDNLKYTIDYSEWVPTAVTVSSVIASDVTVLNPASTDSGEPTLSISSPNILDDVYATYFASSGTDGKRYKVTFQATMSDSQLLESEIEFKVNDI